MNAKRWLKRLGGSLLALAMATLVWGYVLLLDDGGYVLTWPPGSIPMQIKLATSSTLSDGTTEAGSVQAAMQSWNSVLGLVQFSSTTPGVGAAVNGNHVSEIAISDTVDGDPFGTGVLAVTVSYTDGGNTRVESDIVFNSFYTWDSYRGSLRTAQDIRRVALHELGHVLGLDHPDEHGQFVTAIMNSHVSNIDALQTDDINGARSMYGSPGSPAPSNNNFANATTIFLSSGSTQVTGTNVAASAEAGEPAHAGETARRSVWWKWTPSSNGSVTITTLGSNFDTTLGVYTGSSVASLTPIASNDDVQGGVIRTSAVTFTVTSGTAYFIAVDGWDGLMGSVQVNVNFTPVSTPPSITSQPADRQVTIGNNAQFTVSVSGNPAPTLQWYRLPANSGTWVLLTNSGGYSGATTNTLIVIGATAAMSGDRFSCVASNAAGTASSNLVTLTVAGIAPNIVAQPSSTSSTAGANASFSFTVSGNPAPTLQWYRLPAGSGTWVLLSNGGAYSGATSSTLTVIGVTSAMNGDQFSCVAGNATGSANTNIVTLTVTPAVSPTIFNPPVSQTISARSTFLAINPGGFQGSSPVTFQWFKDGVAIPGATSLNFFKSAPTLADTGTYFLRVSNGGGIGMSPDILVTWETVPTSIPWLDAARLGDIVYFLAAAPARIMRYDIVHETWLPPVDLTTIGLAPTAFLPTPEGIFVAYGQIVMRRSGDLQSESFVATASTAVNCLFAFGNFVFFQNGNGFGSVLVSYNRATLIQGPSSGGPWSGPFSHESQPVFSNALNRGFTSQPAPNKIMAFDVAVDGTITFNANSSYGNFAIGRKQYLTPGQETLVDSSGILYDPSGLIYKGSFGQAFDDLTFPNGSTVVALTGNRLTARSQSTYLETGRFTLSSPGYSLFSEGGATFVFGAPSGLGNPSVTKVLLNNFVSASLTPAFDPSNTRFSIEDIFTDSQGVIYLLSRSGQGVVRWSFQQGRFLPTLPTRGRPVASSYAPAVNRYVLAYADGALAQFHFGVDGVERVFGELPSANPALALTAMDEISVLTLRDATVSSTARFVVGPVGEQLNMNSSGTNGLAWDSSTRRLYSGLLSLNSLLSETVPSSGIPPGTGPIGSNIPAPIRLAPDGSAVLASNGRVLNANLTQIGMLTNTVVDGVWLPDGLCTLRVGSSGTEVQKWANVSYALGGTRTLPGQPLRILKINDSRLAVVTSVDGYVAFYLLGSDLSLLSSVTNDSLPPWVDLGVTSQPQSIAVLPGTNASFTITPFSSMIEAISYQWQVLRHTGGGWTNVSDGGQYSGALTSMLRLTNCLPADSTDQYRCIVSNSARTITSNPVALYVVNSLTDFNGDGKSDLLWRSTSTGQVAVWFMDGPTFAGSASMGFVAQDWKSVGIGDFNGDGKADLLWRSTSTGQVAAWFMDGSAFAGSASLGFVSNDWQNAGIGDFNGDGRSDLLWRSTSTGEVAVWFMNGPNFLSSASLGYVSPDWKTIGIADVNRDGKADLLWRSTSTGQVAVWFMNGSTFLGSASLGFVSTAWSSAGVGDFNGDGKIDLLWRNTTTGEVAIWFMDGATFLGSASMGSVSTDWQIMQ